MEINKSGIIITGAASGFGKAMSLYFSSIGAQVFALDINEDSLLKLKTESENKIHIFKCDVSNNSEIEIIIDTIFNSNNAIHVLIRILRDAVGPVMDRVVTRF